MIYLVEIAVDVEVDVPVGDTKNEVAERIRRQVQTALNDWAQSAVGCSIENVDWVGIA